jgi:hypothetical protein
MTERTMNRTDDIRDIAIIIRNIAIIAASIMARQLLVAGGDEYIMISSHRETDLEEASNGLPTNWSK